MSKLAFSRSRTPIGGASAFRVRGGPMRSGRRKRLPRNRHGETQRMIDRAGRDFLVPRQSGKDRQARGVGRSPGIGPLLVDGHVPDRSGVGAPAWAGLAAAVIK